MLPKLFDFGEVAIRGFQFHAVLHTYGFMLAAGFIIDLQVAARRGKRMGVDANLTMDLGLYILVSSLLGAKLLLVIVDWQHYRHDPWSLIRSGGVFYGGLIAAVLTSIWFFRKHKLSVWKMTDILAPSVALGHAIGRLGCFSAGCCYGKPTSAPWGVTFTDPYAREIVGPHWPDERRHVENGYAELPFPFTPLVPPAAAMRATWDAGRELGYLRSWSATRVARELAGIDPVTAIEQELRARWGERPREVAWPLTVLAGVVD